MSTTMRYSARLAGNALKATFPRSASLIYTGHFPAPFLPIFAPRADLIDDTGNQGEAFGVRCLGTALVSPRQPHGSAEIERMKAEKAASMPPHSK